MTIFVFRIILVGLQGKGFLGDPLGNPFRDLDRYRVAQSAVAGTVQPLGKPCKVSHSVRVSLRTESSGVAAPWLSSTG